MMRPAVVSRRLAPRPGTGNRARPRKSAPDGSPLVDFQRDVREVKDMAPHVLSAAVASAGSARQGNDALWKAYGERSVRLCRRLSVRDVRMLLQGFADAAVGDRMVLGSLCEGLLSRDEEATSRDLCSIAIALAKLRVADADAFSWIGSRVASNLEAFDCTDLGSLANAFSRALCRDARPPVELFHAAASRCRSAATASAGEEVSVVTPAAAALLLNGAAVCGHCDADLWEAVLGCVVVPRICEFSVTQASLIMDSIVRCANAVPDPNVLLSAFAEHWVAQDQLERTATPEDLAYIANAFARLGARHHEELNRALAASALRQLSYFTGGQLAMLCNALVSLPSSGRSALFAMVVQHALLAVVSDCSLNELSLLIGAFASTRTLVPRQETAVIYDEVVVRAQCGTASSATLANLCNGLVQFSLAPVNGLRVLAALQPLILKRFGKKSANLRALSAIIAAHAHFGLRDIAFLEEVCRTAAEREQSPIGPDGGGAATPQTLVQLHASLGALGAPVKPLLYRADSELRSVGPQLPLEVVAQSLFATALLGFQVLSAETVATLFARSRELLMSLGVGSSGSADYAVSSPGSRTALQLLAAAEAYCRHNCSPEDNAESSVAAAAAALLAERLDPLCLEPLPPSGILREVSATLRRCDFPGGGALGGGACVISAGSSPPSSAFRADLLLELGGGCGAVAVEVDGPGRFYHAGASPRERLAVCGLKRAALLHRHGAVAHVGFWEWPSDDEGKQDALLLERVAAAVAAAAA